MSDQLINRNVNLEGDAVLAAVWAYMLESRGAQLCDRIEGSYHSILGLPLLPLLAFLRQVGAPPS
ncbi:MAG: hypothetical protein HIU90_00640 [Proteobacteria bacterium]|nr:hypothetical protein [Pseudomonadota bacterium]